jgi:hypothetical protein
VRIRTFNALVVTSISWFLPDTIPHKHLYLDVELERSVSKASAWLTVNIAAQRFCTMTAVRLVGVSGARLLETETIC